MTQPNDPPIGGGAYVQLLALLGFGFGENVDGNITIFTGPQIGAIVGASAGASLTWDGNGFWNPTLGHYQQVGLATITGMPGITGAVLYDFQTGRVTLQYGAVISDLTEAGAWAEFPTWAEFSAWLDEEYGTKAPPLNTILEEAGSPPPFCFSADVKISTPHGEVSIDSLLPGDVVLSFDIGTLRCRQEGASTPSTES